MALALQEPLAHLPLAQDPIQLLTSATESLREASVPLARSNRRDSLYKIAPLAPRSRSLFARPFKRALALKPTEPFARQGATSFYRGHTGTTATFAARARIPDRRARRMAEVLLKAAGSTAPVVGVPSITTLTKLRVRAEQYMQARRFKAQRLLHTLRARFAANAADMADGVADMPRTAKAVQRLYRYPGLA